METFLWETIKLIKLIALLERQASSVNFYKLKSVPMKKQYLNAYNFLFLLGKDTLNSSNIVEYDGINNSKKVFVP